MVNIKIRKAEIGKINVTVDCVMECNTLQVFATAMELEKVVTDVLKGIEKTTGLDIHSTFLEHIAEEFEGEE